MAWRLMCVLQGKSRAMASVSMYADPHKSPRAQVEALLRQGVGLGSPVQPMVKTILIARAQHDPANFEYVTPGLAVYFFEEVPEARYGKPSTRI